MKKKKKKKVAIAVHEMTHALGFSASMFPTYRDPRTGQPYSFQVTRTLTRSFLGTKLSKRVTEILLPTVVQAARLHYGCETISGIELEDQGGSGTATSHWEKRILFDEYMTGSSGRAPVFSNITAALFYDMGWYRVNFTHSETLHWGRFKGCPFVTARCNYLTEAGGFPGYYCTSTTETSCSPGRLARAGCRPVTYDAPLTDPWQIFFSDPYLGGADPLADYCPFFTAYSNGECRDETNARETDASYGSQYARDSLCFTSSLVDNTLGEEPELRAGCYRTLCASTTDLRIKVGKLWWKCDKEGGPLTDVEGFRGSIVCPPAQEVCHKAPRILWPELSEVISKFHIYDEWP
jgi:leishmanolysin